MKYFAVLSLMAVCVAATSHAFVLKEEKENLANSAIDYVSDLKNSAVQKKESIIESVKDAANDKWAYLTDIKDSKISAVKNAVGTKYAKLVAYKEAKEDFVKSLIASNTARLVDAYSAIQDQVQGLHQYKLNLKDKATSLISGAASKVHAKLNEKKEWISNLKTPASSSEVLPLQPIVQKEEPITVRTYVSHEPAVVGTVYVPQIPVQIYEQQQGHLVYGPPDNTYGPSIIPL